jgi:hypothetical protein
MVDGKQLKIYFKVLSWHLPCVTEEGDETPQPGWLVVVTKPLPNIKQETLQLEPTLLLSCIHKIRLTDLS